MSTHHYRDGIYFRRLVDPPGCVEITIPPSIMTSGVIRIDADSWPSIMAAMSRGGGTGESYDLACRLHNEGAER